MRDSPYARFDAAQLILRDELAIDRTLLANERTLLAYLRSGVALGIAGVSIMHFASSDWFRYVGIACVPCGALTVLIGIVRFRRVDRSISRIRKHFQEAQQTEPGKLEQGLREEMP
ncbi:YidH family protein [Candidatus Laterigemmans baculatus]|uniref:YidH family protein n=1 Tax=Candidatus Laterigemmans baculatus TaxID=2770505 RepID=UPI0013D952D2|nr:DUF202 domain-containing protein [Candidatus Laterigemmans baculatus]